MKVEIEEDDYLKLLELSAKATVGLMERTKHSWNYGTISEHYDNWNNLFWNFIPNMKDNEKIIHGLKIKTFVDTRYTEMMAEYREE